MLIIISSIIIYAYVFCKCRGLAEKRIRFPLGLSLVLYLHFRIFLVFVLLNCESLYIEEKEVYRSIFVYRSIEEKGSPGSQKPFLATNFARKIP